MQGVNNNRTNMSSKHQGTGASNPRLSADELYRPHFEAIDNLKTKIEAQQESEDNDLQQNLAKRKEIASNNQRIFTQNLTRHENEFKADYNLKNQLLETSKNQNEQTLQEKKQALAEQKAVNAQKIAEARLAAQQTLEQEQLQQSSQQPKRNVPSKNNSESCVIS